MNGTVRREDAVSRNLHRLLDLCLVWTAVVLAYVVKEMGQIGIPTDPFGLKEILLTLGPMGLIWLTATSILETYSYKRPLTNTITNLTGALALTFALFLAFAYFSRVFVYPRWFLVFFIAFGTALLSVSRIVKEELRHALQRRGRLLRRAVVVGTSRSAIRLIQTLRSHPTYGLSPIGVVSDEALPVELQDIERLGVIDDLEEILTSHRIDDLIVALPGHQHERVVEVAHRCQTKSVRLRVVPDLIEVIAVRATLSEIGDIPLIGLRDPVISGYHAIVKRTFDLIIASLVLAVSWPVMVGIALVIRLTSKGPALFKQERVGENGRSFQMYKFRSMIVGAEEEIARAVKLDELAEPLLPKEQDDPRVTPVGRVLRRWSLDELPQFLNVVKGHMSIVGPRPEERWIVDRYNLWHRKRLSVKPGITGPMQVDGRADLNLDDRVRLELMYIQNYSVFADVKYIARTFPAVWRGKGAY
ncbi:MAG: sugar transferase [Phycisphaerae bacterium]|nr:sugar transferase [Phycisphaerae bacterium]